MDIPTEDHTSFKLGYWIAVHKSSLRIAYTVFWVVIVAGIWISFFVRTVDWITHLQQANEIVRNAAQSIVKWDARVAPEDVQVVKISTVRYNASSVDVLVHVYNPNAIWAASSANYTLSVNGNEVETASLSIAPLQDRYVTRLRIPSTSDVLPNVRMTWGKVVWKKMADAATRLPTQSWAFENASFHEITGDAADAFRTELSFDLVNNSVFGFNQVKAVVAMHTAEGTITALSSVVVDTLLTKESRSIILRWPAALSRLDTPQLYIDLDLLDESKIIRTLQ
ncbi:MAG: hypothetical protein KIH62_004860 [Candidatus Kerfeldbacteria bacterium]|nr:hypothetical protein [Candidatus Kerfeldbacteria bacterium]